MATAYTKTRVSANQRRAITSGTPTYDPYAYERERLAAEASQATARQQMALSASQYEKNLALNREQLAENRKMQKDQIAKQDKASTVSGATGLLGTGVQAAMLYKYLNPTTPGVDTGTGISSFGASNTAGRFTSYSSSSTPSFATDSTLALGNTSSPALTGNVAATGASTALPPASEGLGAAGVGAASQTPQGTTPFVVNQALVPTEAATEGLAGTAPAITSGTEATLGNTLSSAPLSLYVAPAIAGALAPGLVDSIHKDSMENLGHNLTFGIIRNQHDAITYGSATVGAGAGALSGLAIGASYGSVGGPVGAGIGAIIGGIAGAVSSSTWLCTATKNTVGLDEREMLDVIRLRRYALENHKGMMLFYLNEGSKLVNAIMDRNGIEGSKEFYRKLKDIMITPCLKFVKERNMEEAYQLYYDITEELFKEYLPDIEIKEYESEKEVV